MGLHDCSAGKKSERRGEERSGAGVVIRIVLISTRRKKERDED